jgi:uncharacterized membrane protein YphA (DoxX/SURF4 family)
MNLLLWILQILTALLYAASGTMKVFMFDKAREGVQSFDALPKKVWMALGIVELICVLGLIVPDAFHLQTELTVAAASILAAESLIFIGVHLKYRETTTIIMNIVLGLLMAFIAYGRIFLSPI